MALSKVFPIDKSLINPNDRTLVSIAEKAGVNIKTEGNSSDLVPINPADRWYFTKEQLENTPSRRHGYDAVKELSYRQQTANFIQDLGQRLKVTQLCINTAIVYMHRFYVFHSFQCFPWHGMAAAALFLAAKVEEQHRKLEHVIKKGYICRNTGPPLDVNSPGFVTTPWYLQMQADLVFNENVLLQTLGFDVAIDHPHTHVVRCCHLVRASKDLAQTSYFLASNSLHLTTMCLQYKPTVVACFCIHLACKWSSWEIPLSSEKKEWYKYIDSTVTAELLQQLTHEFLNIFENCPSRLKEKIMSVGDGGNMGNPTAYIANSPFDPEPRRPTEDAASTSSHRVAPGVENEPPQEPQPAHHSRHNRPSAASGSGHTSLQHREREYREKKEREKQAMAQQQTGVTKQPSSGQPAAGPSSVKAATSSHHHHHHHNHHGSGHHSNRSSSIGPLDSHSSGKVARSHASSHGNTSGRSQSASMVSGSIKIEPKDILREAAKDSTAFGIALAQNHKDLSSSGGSSRSSNNNNSFAMNNAITSGSDASKDASNSSSKRDSYSLLKPNALLDAATGNNTSGSSLNLSAQKTGGESATPHKQRLNHHANNGDSNSKRAMMSLEQQQQQQNNSSRNSSSSTSRSSLVVDPQLAGNRQQSAVKHEHSRRHLDDGGNTAKQLCASASADLFLPDKKHTSGGATISSLAAGGGAPNYGVQNANNKSSSSHVATSQHQQKVSSVCKTSGGNSSSSRSSSPFGIGSNSSGNGAAAATGGTAGMMQPQDALKSVLKSKLSSGLLPQTNHTIKHPSQQQQHHHSQQTVPNVTAREDKISTVKEEPHTQQFTVKTEVPTSTPSSHSAALSLNTSYPAKKPSLFSPEQPPYEQNEFNFTNISETRVVNDINTKSGSGLQLMNMLSPLMSSPPATSASSSNEGSANGSGKRRMRNYSTSSEPELRPVMKKIDQVEGFENLMRDSTIGIEKLQQVPDLIAPISDGHKDTKHQELPFGIAKEMQPPDIVPPFGNSSTSSQSDLNNTSGGISTTIGGNISSKTQISSIGANSNTTNTTRSNHPIVNGIEHDPGLISSLLKEMTPIPHLSLKVVQQEAANQNASSSSIQTNASSKDSAGEATSIESQQAAATVGQEKDKDRHHHKSKKKNKEKHRHKDKKDKDKSREEKDKKRKHKDKERHSSTGSSNVTVTVGGSSSGHSTDKKHKEKDKDRHHKQAQIINNSASSASENITRPIKIKIQKDKIQPMVISTGSNNSGGSSSGSHSNKSSATQMPTMPLKIKIPKDMIKTEYNNATTTNHDSSSGIGGQQQPPIGLKIKIPKDMLNNCNNSSSTSYHSNSGGYHHNTSNSDVMATGQSTSGSHGNGSGRKRERERVSPQDGGPPVKVSRSSHSSHHHSKSSSTSESKQNGRHSSSSGYHSNHHQQQQQQQHQPKVSLTHDNSNDKAPKSMTMTPAFHQNARNVNARNNYYDRYHSSSSNNNSNASSRAFNSNNNNKSNNSYNDKQINNARLVRNQSNRRNVQPNMSFPYNNNNSNSSDLGRSEHQHAMFVAQQPLSQQQMFFYPPPPVAMNPMSIPPPPALPAFLFPPQTGSQQMYNPYFNPYGLNGVLYHQARHPPLPQEAPPPLPPPPEQPPPPPPPPPPPSD